MIRVDLKHCVCQQVLNTNTKGDLIGSHLLVSGSWTQFLLVGNCYLVPSPATTSSQPQPQYQNITKKHGDCSVTIFRSYQETIIRQEDNLLMIIIDNFSLPSTL